MSQTDKTQHVRHLVLPSGRAIDVVYFDGEPAGATPTAPATVRVQPDMHVCPACEKALVYPVEWEEASPTHWEVQLRCPNCEWLTVGMFDQASVDRFDERLDRGTEALVSDLKRLTHANMEEEIERFSCALASDAIWPMDF